MNFDFLDDLLPWIQVDFHIPTLITGVVTQGRPTSREEWIQTFKIQYGNNQTNLATMKNGIGIDIVGVFCISMCFLYADSFV